ncbi:MAG: hypothetical protein JWQ63_4422 [Mucilaginibacter sp.]|nr:hypothetical protein [Mucilaginibacter sp.]
MDDQLDNNLKKRIREVFENFEDTSADHGWLELRKKFPEEERNRRAFAWIWWGAAAAVFFLFFGIGLWIYDAKVQPQKFTHNKLKNTKTQNINNTKEHPGSINKTTAADENNLARTNSGVKNLNPVNENNPTKPKHKARNSNPLNGNNLAKTNRKAENSNPVNENNLAKTNGRTRNSNSIKSLLKYKKYREPGIIPPILKNDTLTQKANLAQAADNSKPDSNSQSQQLNAAVNPNTQPSKPLTVPQPPAKSISSMFAENKKIDTKKSSEKSDKKVRFGLYAATYFNYAKGSNNQINVGAGVTSDIKLSNNLKLVTGITIAQNSLNYTGGNSVIIAQSNSLPSTSASVSPSYSVSSVATLKNHTASLVGLDIPLNLKYEFNPQKSDAYISAGLSSGTFINETYKSQYSSQTYYSSSVQQTQGETTSKSFNSFYFAKMLNVAMGVGFPFGKNRLIFEPFLKYPIGGLGSQNIHFGAGGINLKFNFQSPKK